MAGLQTLVAAALIAAGPPTKSDVESFAKSAAKTHMDRVLKSPKGADYGVYGLSPLGKTAIYPGNRYRVTGYIDASNTRGVVLRSDWKAVVHINPEDKLVLLGLEHTDVSGDRLLVYEAPAREWCRPDVYREITEGFIREQASFVAAAGKLPVRSRQAFLDRRISRYFADVRKRYGLTPSQLGKILELDRRGN
jgi:hypothetical protein